MGRLVSFLAAKDTLTAPPIFGGETTLSDSKQKGILMLDNEVSKIDVFYKGIECAVPYGNLRDWKYAIPDESKYKKAEDGNKNKKV